MAPPRLDPAFDAAVLATRDRLAAAGATSPTQPEIARELDCSRTRVYTAICRLRRAGLWVDPPRPPPRYPYRLRAPRPARPREPRPWGANRDPEFDERVFQTRAAIAEAEPRYHPTLAEIASRLECSPHRVHTASVRLGQAGRWPKFPGRRQRRPTHAEYRLRAPGPQLPSRFLASPQQAARLLALGTHVPRTPRPRPTEPEPEPEPGDIVLPPPPPPEPPDAPPPPKPKPKRCIPSPRQMARILCATRNS